MSVETEKFGSVGAILRYGALKKVLRS